MVNYDIMILEVVKKIKTEIEFKALITVPTDFNPKKESLPMIVFLHGAGERGNDLSLVTRHGIPKYFVVDPDYHGLRVITVSPQCPANTVWNNISIPLFEFILQTAEEYNADKTRISITGISMGGFGIWELLISHPDFFRAAAPVCGGGMDWRIPYNLSTPIKAFHGEVDPVVPVVYSQILCKAVNDRGGSATLKIYPNVQHNSWDYAYEEPDLIEWLVK